MLEMKIEVRRNWLTVVRGDGLELLNCRIDHRTAEIAAALVSRLVGGAIADAVAQQAPVVEE